MELGEFAQLTFPNNAVQCNVHTQPDASVLIRLIYHIYLLLEDQLKVARNSF